MAEPINFNKARKAKARADDKAVAAANRVQFGRPKSERKLTKALQDKAGRDLDVKKREP
jgi:hypothetical protein